MAENIRAAQSVLSDFFTSIPPEDQPLPKISSMLPGDPSLLSGSSTCFYCGEVGHTAPCCPWTNLPCGYNNCGHTMVLQWSRKPWSFGRRFLTCKGQPRCKHFRWIDYNSTSEHQNIGLSNDITEVGSSGGQTQNPIKVTVEEKGGKITLEGNIDEGHVIGGMDGDMMGGDTAGGFTPDEIMCMRDPRTPEKLSLDINAIISHKETERSRSFVLRECLIYRTPEHIRNLNKAAYTPRVVSIGPYHHSETKYKSMEKVKREYCVALTLRRKKVTVSDLIENIMKYERSIRRPYENIGSFERSEFLAMILVDGCFILEYLLRSCQGQNQQLDVSVQYDLLLQENQIPFFVIQLLFKLTDPLTEDELTINPRYNNPVELVVDCFKRYKTSNPIPPPHMVMHITDIIRILHTPYEKKYSNETYSDIKFTTTATQLHRAGVTFMAVSDKCLLDIEYDGQCLKIPSFEINENEVYVYKNLMVLELCHYPNSTFIRDYFIFMDTVIDTTDDVNLLVQKGVLSNKLGHYSDTTSIYNNFCGGVTRGNGISYLMPVCAKLNADYNKQTNIWRTTFKRDYFGTPFKIVSTLTAISLVLLTLISTVCSILQVM